MTTTPDETSAMGTSCTLALAAPSLAEANYVVCHVFTIGHGYKVVK